MKVCSSALNRGDVVLLRLSNYRGHRKILDHWDSCPYKVMKRVVPDQPAYLIHDGQGSVKTAHQNRLLLLEDVRKFSELVARRADMDHPHDVRDLVTDKCASKENPQDQLSEGSAVPSTSSDLSQVHDTDARSDASNTLAPAEQQV